MSQFSRVKKNSNLYQEIIEDDNTEIIETSLRDYERRMSKEKVEDTDYIASRLKRNKKLVEDINEIEEDNKPEPRVSEKVDILSDRDLLSDFIEEVKHYNINKGLRSVQDTQTNILNNLNNKENKPTESETVLELTTEIKQIINELDKLDIEEEVEETVTLPIIKTLDEKDDENLVSIFEEIETSSINVEEIKEAQNKLVEEDMKIELPIANVTPIEVVEVEEVFETEDKIEQTYDFKANELLELTQTLNLKLDLQEQEIAQVESKDTFLDKLLTVTIVILLVSLFLIIAYGVWWAAQKRGI